MDDVTRVTSLLIRFAIVMAFCGGVCVGLWNL
jgi:hypothetical protein